MAIATVAHLMISNVTISDSWRECDMANGVGLRLKIVGYVQSWGK